MKALGTALQGQDTGAARELYMAMELSDKKWLLVLGDGQRAPSRHTVEAGDTGGVMGAIAKAAGAAAVDGTITTSYVKDAMNPGEQNDPGVKLFEQIMAKYYPKGNIADANLIYAMSVAWTAVNALQRAGKTPTRQGFMNALTSTNTAANPFLLKGVRLQTSKTDHFFIEDLTLTKWANGHWNAFGSFYHHAR